MSYSCHCHELSVSHQKSGLLQTSVQVLPSFDTSIVADAYGWPSVFSHRQNSRVTFW